MTWLLKTLQVIGWLIAIAVVCGVAVGIGALVAAIGALSGFFFTGIIVLILIAAAISEFFQSKSP